MKTLKFLLCFILLFSSSIFPENVKKSDLSNATEQNYPGSDYAIIRNTAILIDKHGMGTYKTEVYKKLLTTKSEKDNSIQFWYDEKYNSINIDLIEIIKTNGKIIKINPKNILKLTNNPGSIKSNIYSGTSKLLTGSLPSLKKHDIIHTIETRKILKSRIEGHFSDRIDVENFYPVIEENYSLTYPSTMKINIHHINNKPKLSKMVSENSNTSDGKTTLSLSIKNAPYLIEEPGMDDSDFFSYYIMITSIESWEYISKWYYNLVAPHLTINDDIKSKTKELIKNAKTKKEMIGNIFYWVARNIRYLGVDKETNRPGLEPHDVTYTFATGGGVCRDKSALLVSMLRYAGINADPIIISSGYQLNKKAPVSWFNHAVAVSYDDNGNPEYFFDPTDETTKDFFPQYLEDCTYLIASKKGDTLKIIPLSSPETNLTEIKIKKDIKNNEMKCDLEINFNGIVDNYIRSWLMNSTLDQKKKMVGQIISKIDPLAELISFDISDPSNKVKNISIKIIFTAKNYLEQQGNYLFIPSDSAKFNLSFIYNYQMSPFNLSQRKYPFKIASPFKITINEKISLDRKLKNISFPEFSNLAYKGFILEQKIEKNSNNISLNSSLSVKNIHFLANDFLLLKNKLTLLENLDFLYIIGESN